MKKTTLKQAISICGTALFSLTVSTVATAETKVSSTYQPIANYTNYNLAADTPTQNDCSLVNGQPRLVFGPDNISVMYVDANWSGGESTGHLDAPYSTLTDAARQVVPGQLVCVKSGTYAPFNISTSGTDLNHIVRFEVIPGATAKIDPVQNGPTSTSPFFGISIENPGPGQPFSSIHYVLVSGFYVLGPDDAISNGSFGGWDAASSNNGEGFYNANCIQALGNLPGSQYVPGQYADHIYIIGNHLEGCPGGGIATAFADYVTIDDNTVHDCSWYSIYGTSGISMLNDFDSNPTDISTPATYKDYVINNTVYNNFEL